MVEKSKKSEQSPPGEPQPEAMEVESARLLANDVMDELTAHGLSEQDVRRLADEFIAEHPRRDPAEFVRWAKERR